jgi:flagellar protein FliJ
MKSQHPLSRLKHFEVGEKRRKVAEIEALISDINVMALDLDRQIAIEQERAGISDTNHYAYPTFAKAAIQRRDNLLASAADLEAKLAIARETLAEALQELKKIELLEERDAELIKPKQTHAAELNAASANVRHRDAREVFTLEEKDAIVEEFGRRLKEKNQTREPLPSSRR